MTYSRFNKYSMVLNRFLKSILSRLFFGNLLTLENNLRPLFDKINIKNYVKNDNDIELKGYLKISYNIDRNIILKIKEKCDLLMNDNNYLIYEPRFKKKVFIKDPLDKIPEIEKLLPLFKKYLDSYYQSNYFIKSTRIWRNYSDESFNHQKQKYVYSNYWHFDQARADEIKIFILLNDDVTRNKGSTRVCDIETTKSATRKMYFLDTSLSTKRFENNYSDMIYYCEGNLGDCFIVRTAACLHAASIPEPGCYRDIIQFQVSRCKENKSDNLFSNEKDPEVYSLLN
jgi:hypothetical protein